MLENVFLTGLLALWSLSLLGCANTSNAPVSGEAKTQAATIEVHEKSSGEQLRDLTQAYEEGLISRGEYERLRQRIIDGQN